MANAFNIPDLLARESLRVAHEKSSFIGTVDRQYDESFKSKGGWKPGDQLRVANPNQYTRTQGSRVMDVQDQTESSQTITLASDASPSAQRASGSRSSTSSNRLLRAMQHAASCCSNELQPRAAASSSHKVLH